MNKNQAVHVDEKLVRENASLARLDLSQAETELFVVQFKDILAYVSMLNEVDTGDVPPAYLSTLNQTEMRPDEIGASAPTGEFLSNAPESRDDYVLIPRVHMEQ
jgi:aspartyl-tRNA(Asn)/glutamyl-tRNA(Gln) amidotransferase subunit C